MFSERFSNLAVPHALRLCHLPGALRGTLFAPGHPTWVTDENTRAKCAAALGQGMGQAPRRPFRA